MIRTFHVLLMVLVVVAGLMSLSAAAQEKGDALAYLLTVRN
ncbi:hypothetical protein GALL_50140 [mine drainage metagenome]|uniref:Uncharacterized protein n=1 Tax=mine drainage metagenome TaxID=410659 RepID=A0A1J5TPF7_9ZZZZ